MASQIPDDLTIDWQILKMADIEMSESDQVITKSGASKKRKIVPEKTKSKPLKTTDTLEKPLPSKEVPLVIAK